jgi:hypothetical protein
MLFKLYERQIRYIRKVVFYLTYLLYNKRACPTKNEPQQGISYLEREREGVRVRGVARGERRGVGGSKREREGEGVRDRGVGGSKREREGGRGER